LTEGGSGGPVDPTTTAAWARLEELAHAFAPDLRAWFAADPARVERLTLSAADLQVDLSKNLVDDTILDALLALADDVGVTARRDAMFRGDPINVTEHRAVLHTALRLPADATLEVDGHDVVAPVHEVLGRVYAFADRVRSGAWKGATGARIRTVVNIGIGGSDLGPVMAYEALKPYVAADLECRFISNIDPTDCATTLADLDPATTLFIVSSKTFGTLETLTNARLCRAWLLEGLGETDPTAAVAKHFVAVSTALDKVADFGIDPDNAFGFWDWVGGRYSLWSAIGLPIALAIGAEGFRGLLAGAHAMDEHFRTAPLAQNLPVRLGLLDVWYRNFHRFTSRSIAPYHSALRRLPAYLQQLEMESNGKQVDASGEALPFGTSPVLWGEPGTNGQHAYFQMLHQGTDVIPLEFVAVREAAHDLEGHHPKLLANALAQAQALMVGKADAGGHKNFPGNRPSSFFVLDKLTPESLGAFLALYEHRVFTSGALWGINSFDQWGVELGKVLARDIEARLASGDTQGLDASTAGLLQRLR